MLFVLSSAWWPPVLQTVIGGLIGALGAIAGGAFSSWFARQQERQSVAAAFAGEIQGLLNVVALRHAAEGVLQGKRFPIDDHPFLVFEANVSKIGFLPAPLASKVAEFYSVARGIAVDFRTLYKGEVPAGFSEEAFRLNLSRDLGTLEPKAIALVAELQKEAVRDWKQVLQPN